VEPVGDPLDLAGEQRFELGHRALGAGRYVAHVLGTSSVLGAMPPAVANGAGALGAGRMLPPAMAESDDVVGSLPAAPWAMKHQVTALRVQPASTRMRP